MNDLLRGRRVCIGSIVCSSIFLIVELAMRAYGCALVQTALLTLAAILLARFNRRIARWEASLPPPAAQTSRT